MKRYLFGFLLILCSKFGDAQNYMDSQEIQCSFISEDGGDVECTTTVQFEDRNPTKYGVEYLTTFQFPGIECVNPRITLDFVSQDYDSANEVLRVHDGSSTSDTELAECGDKDDHSCVFENCVTDAPLSQTTMGEANILIFVSAEVQGINPSYNEVCEGGNQLDAILTLTCDGMAQCGTSCGTMENLETDVSALKQTVETLRQDVDDLKATMTAFKELLGNNGFR